MEIKLARIAVVWNGGTPAGTLASLCLCLCYYFVHILTQIDTFKHYLISRWLFKSCSEQVPVFSICISPSTLGLSIIQNSPWIFCLAHSCILSIRAKLLCAPLLFTFIKIIGLAFQVCCNAVSASL